MRRRGDDPLGSLFSDIGNGVDSLLGITTADVQSSSSLIIATTTQPGNDGSPTASSSMSVLTDPASTQFIAQSTFSTTSFSISVFDTSSSTALPVSQSTFQTSMSASITASSTIPIVPSSTPPAPISPLDTGKPQPTPSPQASNSNTISQGGIAVAAILSLAVLATAAFLIVCWCPPVRRKWDQWQARRLSDRTYRAGIDGPFENAAQGGKGLGLGRISQLRTVSFLNHRGIAELPGSPGDETHCEKISHNGHERLSSIGLAIPMDSPGTQRVYMR